VTSRQKLLIDRIIGLPIVFVLNGLCRILGKVLRRDHSIQPEALKTVVVAKFFGMGSILQATPLLRSLRERFPGARIMFVTDLRNRPLIERLEHIDEGLFVDDRDPFRLAASTARILLEMIRRRIDLYFDLEVYAAYATLIALLSLARNRFGFYRYSTRFKHGIYTHLVYFNARLPIRTIYLQLGLAAGSQPPDEDRLGPLRLQEQDRASFAFKWAATLGDAASGRYVAVNPNASDLLLERRWPAASFVFVIERLTRHGIRVALTGAPAEKSYVDQLVSELSPEARSRVINTAGALSLGELFVLLEGAACVVTNDTGPMHFAVALGQPTVCLFGPCNPDHYGFPSGRVEILYRQVFCSPCVHEIAEPPCGGNNVCMKLIEPTSVVAAAERLLGIGAPHRTPEDRLPLRGPSAEVYDAFGTPLGLVVRKSIGPHRATVPGARQTGTDSENT
jgi:ADP-heptose:LPS heptosyltransferase